MDAAHPRPRPSRRTATLLITPIVVLIVLSTAGDMLTTSLAPHHPLLLLAMNARNRVVLLVTNQLDPVSYYVVGTARLLLSDPLFFLLGMHYGDAGLRAVEGRSKTLGNLLRLYEQLFQKAAYPLVFIAPNNIICLFAGASGMGLAAFVTLNVTGTITRLYLLRVAGNTFSDPISSVLSFMGRYFWPLLAFSVVSVLFLVLLDRRRGTSEIGALLEFEEAIETEEADE